MMEDNTIPILVVSNSKGGCIEVDVSDPDECCIIVKQGDRYASLIGNVGLLMDTGLEAGKELKGGRIITKERLEPYDPDDPEFLVKRRNGRVCRRNGQVIYTHSYFTYDKRDYDEIIQADS